MRLIPVPKGTRVVILRHAISDWNEESIKALVAGELRPSRLPGKRNAPLSPMGHLQAYFAGEYLQSQISSHLFGRRGILARSLHMRAKETARILSEAGNLETARRFQSDLLAERAHARYAFVQKPEVGNDLSDCGIPGCMRVKNVESTPLPGLVNTDMADMRELLRHQPMLSRVLMSNADMHLATAFLLTSFRDSLEFFYNQAKAKHIRLDDPKIHSEIRKEAAGQALRDFGSRIAKDFTEWFYDQEELPPHQRRKTPTGESFEDLSSRAQDFWDEFISEIEYVGQGAVAIIVSHSIFILQLRKSIEGFSNHDLNMMLKAEGPPFPPHVGMTFYKESDGYLRLDGEPYRLPPQFEVVGRRLRFKDSVDPEIIAEACKVLGIEEYQKKPNRERSGNRKHSDHRFRFVLNPEDAPKLAKTGSPAMKDFEKKAS
jgi:broad specificity phosphatase PhoE